MHSFISGFLNGDGNPYCCDSTYEIGEDGGIGPSAPIALTEFGGLTVIGETEKAYKINKTFSDDSNIIFWIPKSVMHSSTHINSWAIKILFNNMLKAAKIAKTKLR